MKLSDLLPVEELRKFCEQFTLMTGATMAILDLNGNILVATGWREICTRFHRAHAGTAARCRESDTVLAARLAQGEIYNVYKCRNGLIDVAVPITVGGEHVGNFFTGQFFFDPPDEAAFREQAREFDFPKDDYMACLAKVPVVSEEKVQALIGFVTHFTHLIGDMALTKRKQEQANQELSQSKMLLQTIIDTVPIRVFWKDRASRYLGCNPLFAQDAGYESPEEIVGKEDAQLPWADYAEAYRLDDRQVVETGRPKLFFDEPVNPLNGRMMWGRTSKTPLRNREGDIIGVLGIYEDITEQRVAEEMLVRKNEELERSNADLERFAYVSSHDLQTPLRNIVHYTQLLKRRYKDKLDDEADTYIGFIVDGGKRMSRMITSLLGYSRATHNLAELSRVSAGQAVAAALANLAMEIADAEVTVEDLPMVMAEGTMLTSIFQNLIGNAAKYRSPDRRLAVTVRAEPEEPGMVRFSVADNGIGMAAEHHEKAFEIFQRLNPALGEGAGIGLALCRRIIHRFGGRIWLESTLGQGTTFYFTLRVA